VTPAFPRDFTILVPPGKVRERIDLYLTHHVANATRAKVQQAIRNGSVTVNGKTVKTSFIVHGGQEIHVVLPTPPPPDVVAEPIDLDIVYEDEYLLVVNKPAGMVTHPAYGNYTGTLVNALLYHCREKLSTLNDTTRPGIVHRLDKDTSGIMVVAKDDVTHARLAKQFSQRTIEREYQALVWGLFGDAASGVIDAALGRSKSDRKKIAVISAGKSAVTEYAVLENFEYLSLVSLHLKTGRTHQIRVHLHHIGHPVFGDPTYGGRRIAWGGTDRSRKEEVHALLGLIGRQTLHARTIGFFHPATREPMRFESPLPSDFAAVLACLRKKNLR
jgi:23S rRNA pseudouridine1911/1915/1917 synthase